VFEFQLAVYFTQKKTFGILPLSLSPVFVQRTSSELAHAHVGRTREPERRNTRNLKSTSTAARLR
jgi:hypothetical protein